MSYRVSILPRRIELPLTLLAVGLFLSTDINSAPAPMVIELTQIPCQFLESENSVNHGFHSTNIKDCEAINARTSVVRLARVKPLMLSPGKYIFRVENQSVPYELGFWLRGDGAVNRVRLPSISGGNLLLGKTKDYAITLKPGHYVYSCPLNNTPDYKIVVK